MDGLIELRSRFPKQPIAIVSAFDDDDAMQKAAVFGAAGFIRKPARRHRSCLPSPPFYAATASSDRGQGQGERPDAAVDELTSKLETLTRQQLRVLHFLCAGMLNKQIAHELSVGETTVKAHVSEILRKMNVTCGARRARNRQARNRGLCTHCLPAAAIRTQSTEAVRSAFHRPVWRPFQPARLTPSINLGGGADGR